MSGKQSPPPSPVQQPERPPRIGCSPSLPQCQPCSPLPSRARQGPGKAVAVEQPWQARKWLSVPLQWWCWGRAVARHGCCCWTPAMLCSASPRALLAVAKCCGQKLRCLLWLCNGLHVCSGSFFWRQGKGNDEVGIRQRWGQERKGLPEGSGAGAAGLVALSRQHEGAWLGVLREGSFLGDELLGLPRPAPLQWHFGRPLPAQWQQSKQAQRWHKYWDEAGNGTLRCDV